MQIGVSDVQLRRAHFCKLRSLALIAAGLEHVVCLVPVQKIQELCLVVSLLLVT